MPAYFYVIDGQELEIRFLPLRGLRISLDGKEVARPWFVTGAKVSFTDAEGAKWEVRVRQVFYVTIVTVTKDGKQVVGWRR